MMKYYLICIFLFAGSLTDPAIGATGFEKADSLFRAGKYYPASVEYERIVFLSADNSIQTKALIKKAECYKQSALFGEAEKTTDRITLAGLNDTLIVEAHYQAALCAYLAGNFSNAENHLIQMHSLIPDHSLTDPSLPLYSLVLNELHRWSEAKIKAIRGIETTNLSPSEKDSLLNLVSSMYAPDRYPHLKSAEKAQRMSSFLPGLGQVYAGYFWEGAASAFLNAATIGMMGYWIYSKLYFTGVFTGSAIFAKFYEGGTYRAGFLVEKRNYKLSRSYNDRLKTVILNGVK